MTTKTDCYIYSLFIPNSQDGITDGVFFFFVHWPENNGQWSWTWARERRFALQRPLRPC